MSKTYKLTEKQAAELENYQRNARMMQQMTNTYLQGLAAGLEVPENYEYNPNTKQFTKPTNNANNAKDKNTANS
jgi:hypothetical protein